MWPGAWSGRSQRWRGSRLSGVTGFALGVRGGDGGLRAMASSLGAGVGRYSTSIREDRAGWEDVPDFVTSMTSSDRATRASRGEHETRGPVAFMRDIMVIGSTGFRTFVDPKGDLHAAIQSCRTAKILPVNPQKPGAVESAQTILGPEGSQGSLRSIVG